MQSTNAVEEVQDAHISPVLPQYIAAIASSYCSPSTLQHPTGAAVPTPPGAPPPHIGVLPGTCLDSKRRLEIIELLDAEPTLDYLAQNGVLCRSDVTDLEQLQLEPRAQNNRLLELVESWSDGSGILLLTNVLRLTGQHYLANLLDDGVRIQAFTGSGYLNRPRHRGQVSLTIRVKSIRIASSCSSNSNSSGNQQQQQQQQNRPSEQLGISGWISLEDIQTRMTSLKRRQRASMFNPSTQQIRWSKLPDVAEQPDIVVNKLQSALELETSAKQRRSLCCLCCFRCCRNDETPEVASPKNATTPSTKIPSPRRPHSELIGSAQSESSGAGFDGFNGRRSLVLVPSQVHQQPATASAMNVSNEPSARKAVSADSVWTATKAQNSVDVLSAAGRAPLTELERLRRAADTVQALCADFYSSLVDGCAARSAVERYIEQDRGILVLCVERVGVSAGVNIVCICTRQQHVAQLRLDAVSGQLTADMNRVISTASQQQLCVDVDCKDSQLALAELQTK